MATNADWRCICGHHNEYFMTECAECQKSRGIDFGTHAGKCTCYLFLPGNLNNYGDTVEVVIFAGGKFCENVGKTFHVGEIFMILLLLPS